MSDLRDTIAAAFDTNESETPMPEPAAPAIEAPAPAPTETTPAETAEQREARARDDKGRFAPKSATAAPKPAEGTPTEAPKTAAPNGTEPPKPATPTPSGPELRAPQSWKPEIREKWNALPAEVKQTLYPEIERREKEIARALNESAGPRKFHQEFTQTIAPYAAMLQAEGLQPMQAVSDLMRTAFALRTAPPQHRAALVANMVRTFGVPIDALDAALSGEAPQVPSQQPPAPQQFRDPRFDMLIQQAAQRQQQALAQEVATASEKLEFFADVRGDMADLVEAASKRGVALSLEDAYNRACLLHPEVSKVLEQRKAAQAAATASAATQQARAAASSVRGQPAAAIPGDKPKDLRSTIEAAFDAAAGR